MSDVVTGACGKRRSKLPAEAAEAPTAALQATDETHAAAHLNQFATEDQEGARVDSIAPSQPGVAGLEAAATRRLQPPASSHASSALPAGKPFLGGFIDRRKGTIFHHAATQSDPLPRRPACAPGVSTGAQTDKPRCSRATQCAHDAATQCLQPDWAEDGSERRMVELPTGGTWGSLAIACIVCGLTRESWDDAPFALLGLSAAQLIDVVPALHLTRVPSALVPQLCQCVSVEPPPCDHSCISATAGPYVSGEQVLARRHAAATTIQRHWRGWQAQSAVTSLLQARADLAAFLAQQAQQQAEAAEAARQHEVRRRMQPRTRADFVLLYDEVRHGRGGSADNTASMHATADWQLFNVQLWVARTPETSAGVFG